MYRLRLTSATATELPPAMIETTDNRSTRGTNGPGGHCPKRSTICKKNMTNWPTPHVMQMQKRSA